MADRRVRIVKACISHIDMLTEIENACFTVPWSRDSLEEDLTRNLLAEYIAAFYDGKVVGYAGMWKIIDEAHVTNIAVLPDYRRKGVGGILLRELMKKAAKGGLRLMTLEVRASNDSALRLYAKAGFKADGLRKRYYADNNEDAVLMSRIL